MLIPLDHPDAKTGCRPSRPNAPAYSMPGSPHRSRICCSSSHDPKRFDIRSVPGIAKSLGIEARIVEI